ncbi:DUF6232 family protein [Chloroflexota bacterium]
MSSDRVFYSDDSGVTITSTRAIFGDTTYSMANISSLRTEEIPPKMGCQIYVILTGLAVSFMGLIHWAFIIFGILILLIGLLWARSISGEYHIVITSAAGEKSALQSKDKEYIDRIERAINEAIISRG